MRVRSGYAVQDRSFGNSVFGMAHDLDGYGAGIVWGGLNGRPQGNINSFDLRRYIYLLEAHGKLLKFML